MTRAERSAMAAAVRRARHAPGALVGDPQRWRDALHHTRLDPIFSKVIGQLTLGDDCPNVEAWCRHCRALGRVDASLRRTGLAIAFLELPAMRGFLARLNDGAR